MRTSGVVEIIDRKQVRQLARPNMNPKIPLPTGDPAPILYMVNFVPTCPHPKLHLDRFSSFSTAPGRDQQTDAQTETLPDHATTVTIWSAAMWPNNNNATKFFYINANTRRGKKANEAK